MKVLTGVGKGGARTGSASSKASEVGWASYLFQDKRPHTRVYIVGGKKTLPTTDSQGNKKGTLSLVCGVEYSIF